MPLLEESSTLEVAEARRSAIRLGQSKPLTAKVEPRSFVEGVKRKAGRVALLFLYVLATVQFVGAYIYLEWPYVDVHLWERGYAPLPFQTRLLLAPLYRLADSGSWSLDYAAKLARNTYFFPHGVTPGMVLEFYLGIASVLISGWVATRLYAAGSRRHLLGALVYPLFLGLCTLAYIVHTVQNFRYVYDMPSLAAFSIGFYLIYFPQARAVVRAVVYGRHAEPRDHAVAASILGGLPIDRAGRACRLEEALQSACPGCRGTPWHLLGNLAPRGLWHFLYQCLGVLPTAALQPAMLPAFTLLAAACQRLRVPVALPACVSPPDR